MRAWTARGGHLDADGRIRVELVVPPESEALEAARRYRQVVATQSYDFGKDVFAATPLAFRYHRREGEGFRRQDGRPYRVGETIVDRPINTDAGDFAYGIGIAPTLIEDNTVSDYLPLME